MADTAEFVRSVVDEYGATNTLYDRVSVADRMCNVLLRYATSIDETGAALQQLRRENDALRGMLANRGGPCVYCALPQEDWLKCRDGFPGCSRVDDAMLCPHVGASLDADRRVQELEMAVESLTKKLQAFMKDD